MDITDDFLKNVSLHNGINEVNFSTPTHQITGEVIVADCRVWQGPNYNSCDGLPTKISGEVHSDFDIYVWDNDENDVEFELNENKIILNFEE